MSAGTPRSSITLIDGGMGRELKDRGVRVPDTIWSAAALMEAPDEVTNLHGDFLDAGAELIIANNYAVVPVLLRLERLEDHLERLISIALDCAETARRGRAFTVPIAGSLPPLEHTYRPDLVQPYTENIATYRRIISAMAGRPDLFTAGPTRLIGSPSTARFDGLLARCLQCSPSTTGG